MVSPNNRIPTLSFRESAFERCLDVLDHMFRAETPMTVAAVSAGLSRSPADVMGVFRVLIDRGYLAPAPEGGGFEVTPKVLTLATNTNAMRRLAGLAAPQLETVAKRLQSPCHLSVAVKHWMVTIARSDPRTEANFSIQAEHHNKVAGCAAGILLFGMGTLDQRETVATAERPHMDERDWAAFNDRANRARSDGYCIASNGVFPGVLDTAVPIFDDAGVRAVLTVSHWSSDTRATASFALPLLQQASETISKALGHVRPHFATVGNDRAAPCPPTFRVVK